MVIGKVHYLILSLALCCLVVSMWSAWFYFLPTECVSLFLWVSEQTAIIYFPLPHEQETCPRAHPVSCTMDIGASSRG